MKKRILISIFTMFSLLLSTCVMGVPMYAQAEEFDEGAYECAQLEGCSEASHAVGCPLYEEIIVPEDTVEGTDENPETVDKTIEDTTEFSDGAEETTHTDKKSENENTEPISKLAGMAKAMKDDPENENTETVSDTEGKSVSEPVTTYEELVDAITQASDTEETVITLGANIELEEMIVVEKNIKIIGAGHVITRKSKQVEPSQNEIDLTIVLRKNSTGEYEAGKFTEEFSNVIDFTAFQVTGNLTLENVILDGAAPNWDYLRPQPGETWNTALGTNSEMGFSMSGPVYTDQNGKKVYGYEMIPNSADTLATKEMIQVTDSGELTLESSTIQNVMSTISGALISATGSDQKKAQVIFNNSVVSHCAGTNNGMIYGKNYADFVLSGNTQIKGNYNPSQNNHAVFQMYNGSTLTVKDATSISENFYHGNGAIGLYGGSSLILENGQITGNRFVSAMTNNNWGSTIYIHSTSSLVMNGGRVGDNFVNFGGVICANSSAPQASINGGTIENNIGSTNNREEGLYVRSEQGNVTVGENAIVHGYTVVNGTLTNNGTIAGLINNQTTGTVTNNGVVNGNISNRGTTTNSGEVNGNVASNGTVENSGVINGDVSISGGTYTDAGTLNGDITITAGNAELNPDYIEGKTHIIRTNKNDANVKKDMYVEELSDILNKVNDGDILNIQLKETLSYDQTKNVLEFWGNTEKLQISDLSVNNDDIIQINEAGTIHTTGIGTVVLTGTGSYQADENTPVQFDFSMELESQPGVLKILNGEQVLTYTEKEQKTISDFITFVYEDDENKKVTLEEGKDIEYVYGDTTHKALPTTVGEYEITVKLLNPNYLLPDELKVKAVVGHDISKVEAKEASCTEKGNSEYYYCESCDLYFIDAEAKENITEEDTVIAPLGHAFGEWEITKEATVTSEGEKVRKCSRCNEEEIEILPMLGGEPDPEKPDTEKPDTEKPDTDKPDTEQPNTDKPDTEKPNTDKPNTDKPSTDKPNNDNSSVKTGDGTNILLWGVLSFGSGIILLYCLYRKKRKLNH